MTLFNGIFDRRLQTSSRFFVARQYAHRAAEPIDLPWTFFALPRAMLCEAARTRRTLESAMKQVQNDATRSITQNAAKLPVP